MATSMTPSVAPEANAGGAGVVDAANGVGAHSNAHPDEKFRAEFVAKLEAAETKATTAPARDAQGKFTGSATPAGSNAGTQDRASTGTTEDPNAAPTEDPVTTDSATGATDSTETTSAEAGTQNTKEEDEAFDAKFGDAMAKHGATLDLNELPAEVRPVVAKKMKAMEAGFTRVMQELRGEQKASLADKAELRFQREQPAAFIVAQLLANPEIADAVNASLAEMETSENARKYHGVIVDAARQKALETVTTEADAAIRKADRGAEIERYGKAAAQAAGLPDALWPGLEAAIALHVTEHGDITDADVKALAKRHAAPYKAMVAEQERARKRDASQRYVAAKVADARTAGLVVKPGAGNAPGVGAKPVAKNDDEFKADLMARLP